MKKAITLILILLAIPSTAEARGKTFTVGESVVKWASPQKYGRDETVTVRFRYKGLDLTANTVIQNCVIDYAGFGIVVRLWACDNGSKPSPLRVRIASARDDTAKVKMTYWR